MCETFLLPLQNRNSNCMFTSGRQANYIERKIPLLVSETTDVHNTLRLQNAAEPQTVARRLIIGKNYVTEVECELEYIMKNNLISLYCTHLSHQRYLYRVTRDESFLS